MGSNPTRPPILVVGQVPPRVLLAECLGRLLESAALRLGGVVGGLRMPPGGPGGVGRGLWAAGPIPVRSGGPGASAGESRVSRREREGPSYCEVKSLVGHHPGDRFGEEGHGLGQRDVRS